MKRRFEDVGRMVPRLDPTDPAIEAERRMLEVKYAHLLKPAPRRAPRATNNAQRMRRVQRKAR